MNYEVVAQIRADQRERWLRGQRVPVESYLDSHPDLRGQDEAALDLIYGEVLLREEAGEKVDAAEYLGRFPQYADRLRRQFELHEALRDSAPSGWRDTVSMPGPNGATSVAPAPREAVPEGPEVPGYEILERLGTGNYGVVYKARQADLKRVVALKMIRFEEDLADPQRLALIRREAEAVARLNHAHIVQIYGFDGHQGRPYFTMEYVEGGSLEQRLKRGPLPPREAAELAETLARALHAVHQAGIVHRDLKPGNVLLTKEGRPKVADFGLAKLPNTEGSLIPSGAVVGTVSYMAPEQAAGKGREVKAPADVYALGAILYHMVTGRPPFEGGIFLDVLRQVLSREPKPLGLGREQRDLEAICLKCLEKNPAERYASAAALADDLRRYLEGEPTLARPRRWYEKAWRGVRKRPWVAVAAVLCLVMPLALPLMVPRQEGMTAQPDPDLERKRAAALLADGKPYEFAGNESLPGPFRWVEGLDGKLKAETAEGCFSLESLGRCLLEFTPDPGSERYLFSLEVRHDDSGGPSEVGIFFGLRRTPNGPARPKYGYYTLMFADRGDKTRWQGRKDPRRSFLELYAHTRNNQKDEPNHVKTSLTFRPLEPVMPDVWRKLGVLVTPEAVTVFWRNDEGKWQPVDRIAVNLLEARFQWLTRHAPEVAEIPSAFSPRLGLGLCVSRGKASFRRVELTPLPVNVPFHKERP